MIHYYEIMNRLALALGLSLMSVAFAETASLPTVPIATYLPISLVAFTISLDVVAIGYIISKLFPSSGISGWINSEYWELAKTAMLIAGVYAILMFISNVAIIFSGGTPSNNLTTNLNSIVSTSNAYFEETEKEIGYSLNTFYYYSLTIGGLRSVVISLNPFVNVPPMPGVPFYIKWGFSTSIYANQLLEKGSSYESMINDAFSLLLIPMAFLTYVLHKGLTYAIILGLWIFLPLGILFRAFPFVRGIGGTLIGIGMGIGIIFPATVIIFNIPVSKAMLFMTPTGNGATPSFISTIINRVLTSLTSLDIIGSIFPFLNLFWGYGAYIVLLLLVYILDLAIVYALADNIAKLLGGSFKLGLTGKMRFI